MVIVVSHSQLLNIVIKIDITVIQFIIGASVRVSEKQCRCGCHGCNDVGGTDIDNVCIALDMMVHRMEVDLRYLMFGKERLELPHCYGIILGVVE